MNHHSLSPGTGRGLALAAGFGLCIVLATSGGCLYGFASLLPADGSTDTTTAGSTDDPTAASRTGVGLQGPQGEQGEPGEQGPQGEQGPIGTSCWDLNENGEADAEEDTNGDGVVNVLDCQGKPGADGADGSDGADGRDGRAGADGEDLTGVLARGVIPSDGNPLAVAGKGIESVERTGLGHYVVEISLADFPEDALPAQAEDLAVMITVSGQPLLSYYETTLVTSEIARIEIGIVGLVTGPTDATFSITVFGP